MSSLCIGEEVAELRRSSKSVGLSDIASEGALLAGAGAAILLQLAHPAVGRGVARHSDFASDPMSRLRSTLTYIYVAVDGNDRERRAVRDRVTARHESVTGGDYDARDPELQLWVAATLYATAMDVYDRLVGPLDPDAAAFVYREYAILGTTLDMPRELWPADLVSFRKYWSGMLTRLAVTTETRAVAHELLHPSHLPWWLRALMPSARLATAGLLPDEVREGFGLPWGARRARRFEHFVNVVAILNRHLPNWVRHWPRDHYLALFRKNLRS